MGEAREPDNACDLTAGIRVELALKTSSWTAIDTAGIVGCRFRYIFLYFAL